MEILKVIVTDIFNPVIHYVDTTNDDNETCLKITKIIENLHDQKITEILTINYVLKECDAKINMRQKRVLQSLMKDCFFQIPLSQTI